jgi:hypothetical protein
MEKELSDSDVKAYLIFLAVECSVAVSMHNN